jgi:hypothetical protein
MTMKREAKAEAQRVATGAQVKKSGYSGKPLTVKEYAKGYLGRGRTDQGTAQVKKLEKAGWAYIEGNGTYRRLTRRG